MAVAVRRVPGRGAARSAEAWPPGSDVRGRRQLPAEPVTAARRVAPAQPAAPLPPAGRATPVRHAGHAERPARAPPVRPGALLAWPADALPPADESGGPPAVGGSAPPNAALPPRASLLSGQARFRRPSPVPARDA